MRKYTVKMNEISIFNKNEKKLISHIVKCSIDKKIAEITVDEDTISQITRVGKDNLFKFLTKLSSKLIEIEIDENKEHFNLISNVFTILKHYNLFVFIISPIIFNSIYGDDYFSKFDIQYFFMMKEKKSYKLYNYLINIDKNYVEVNVDDLKIMISDKDTYYERFFDFEKNVIKPIVNDININTNISIHYSKIRYGKQIGAISFFFDDSKYNDTDQLLNSIFEQYNFKIKNISDLSVVKKNINNLLNVYSIAELEQYFRYLSNRYQSNYDEKIFIKSLEMTTVKKYFSPGLFFFEYFNTTIELFNFLCKELEKLNLDIKIDQNFFPPDFLILAYSGTLTDYQFQNDILRIDIHFVKLKKSSIFISLFQ